MDDNHPRKKRKLEPAKHISVEDLRQSLQVQNPDGAVGVLNQLRSQLTVRSDEGAIQPQDERLLFAQRWLESSSGAYDLFSLWEKTNVRQPNLPVIIVSTLAALLTLLSSHYTYHALGHPIVKTLLSSQWMRRLNSYVGSAHNELILVTLKLLNVISAFAGGREKKNLLDVFQWEIKSLPKLLNLRRKGKVDYHPLSRPDIRTLYILFILSFLDAPTQTKSTFLEQHRDAFLAIFKGLPQDHYLFTRHVLETIWINLWSDPKLKRTTKVGLFNEITISHLLKIYERKSSDSEDPEQIPADLVHHFLLAICTRPGTGICFRDRGWYPREDTGEERGGKIYNKILANVVKTLKVNEDSRKQELARKILEACPELVAGYWPSAQLTLEPRLSTKWIANISFFGTIISSPVPEHTFLLPNTTLYNPTPPSLQNILSNILPSEISPKNIFTKGLLSPSGLVQHCTALALAKCLMKYAKVQEIFRAIEDALEVCDAEEGQWGRRRKELKKELRKRVPEFQVIVGFSQQQQQKPVPPPTPTADHSAKPSSQKQPNPVKNALSQESAQRLLLLYHKHLPEVVVEARFDVGKTLTGLGGPASDGGEEDIPSAAQKLQLVQQLHVLRTLKASDQFIWTNKSPSSHTYLYTLLKSYITANIPALRSTLLDLLSHLLSNSMLFQETPTEPRLWLISLPRLLRAPNATSPDGVDLTDEGESVITFLDDCIQRCLKTPFRYIEEMQGLLAEERKENEVSEIYPSPLIMTLGEQLDAKIKAGLLTPSDLLAIISFTRKLVFRLLGQVQELGVLESFVSWIDRILPVERLWAGEYPVMTAAVRREVKALYAIVNPKEVQTQMVLGENVQDWLNEAENLADVGKPHDHILVAHSIIDRLRFMEQTLSTSGAKRIMLGVRTHHAPALQDFAQYLFPRSGHLWENHVLVETDVSEVIPAEWLFCDATKEQISDSDYRRGFVTTFFSTRPTLQNCLELLRIIGHRLRAMDDGGVRGLLSLLAVLTSEARVHIKEADMVTLKESLFARPGVIKRLAMGRNTNDKAQSGLRELLQGSFDPRSANDRRILSEVSTHWLVFLQDCLRSREYNKFGDVVLWIKYLPSIEILRLFDLLTSDNKLTPGSQHAVPLLQSILPVIQSLTEDEPDIKNALRERTPQLLALQKQLIGSRVVEDLLSAAIDSTLPVGHSAGPWGFLCEAPSSFTKLIKRAESDWMNRIQSLGRSIPLNDFLTSDTWTSSTITIISGLLYKQGLPLHDFETWLRSEHAPSKSAEHLSVILQVALDIYRCGPSTRLPLDANTWIPHLSRISSLCFDDNVQPSSRRASCTCLVLAFNIFQESLKDLIQVLTKHIADRRNIRPTPESLRLGSEYPNPEISSVLLEWSLHWLIGQLTEDTSVPMEKTRVTEGINALIQSSPTIKSPQVETLMGAVLQHHLSDATMVNLVIQCISKTHLKPSTVNRYLQSMLHHPQFLKLSKRGAHEPSTRPHVVELLHILFNLHPTNTCQITQIEPLLQIYHGTLSKEDLALFSIFQLFEIQRKTSLHSLFNHWSSSTDIACSSTLESVQSLDPIAVFQMTLHFPKWRKLRVDSPDKSSGHSVHLYDPIFLLLLFHSVLSESQPSTPFGWIELFRTNIIGLCIRVISSEDPALRELGLSQIALLYQNLESVEFQEKAHVVYILNLLKDLLPPTETNDPPPRLPSYTTLMLAHALRGVFYPSNFIYPLTARFLLQRPELDISDVPMLYSMLYSNSDDWRKERSWIIRYLANGMASSEDWRVLKRRHTWDLLASLFQSSEADNVLRKAIFEVIANLTCNPLAVTSMIHKSSLLPWLEMQISQANGDESVKWARILGNIVLTVNHKKMDSTLQSGWRTSVCHCLSILFKRSRSDILLPAAHIIFKIGESSNVPISELGSAIKLAVGALEEYETLLDTTIVLASDGFDTFTRYDLYRGSAINDPVATPPSYHIWLDCVTLLWRTTMRLDHKIPSWDLLTCRLLASRHNHNDNTIRSEIEWVRKEVVRSLLAS